jgi:hypothetical protein
MAEDANQVIVERTAAVIAAASRWMGRARVAAPFVAAAFAAVALTSASIYIERHGPQFIILRETCGPRGKDYCFDPVLKGGFPIAYLYDTPFGRTGTLSRSEDNFRRGPFLLDVLIYFAAFVLGRETVARLRARRSRLPEVAVRSSVSEDLPSVQDSTSEDSTSEDSTSVEDSAIVEELPVVKSPPPREKSRPEQAQIVVERTPHPAPAKSRRMTEDHGSSEIEIAPGDRELARDAILAELDFSRSLVRMYRKLQMQAVWFTVALYLAALALIGWASDSTRLLLAVASYSTALLPVPVAVLVLVFAVLEARIRRAGRHNRHTISPKLEAMREVRSMPPLLEWESNSGRWLTRLERLMASSMILVIAMALPALAGTAWHLFAGAIPRKVSHPIAAAVDGILLVAVALLAAWLSIAQESPEQSTTDADHRLVKPISSRSRARTRS